VARFSDHHPRGIHGETPGGGGGRGHRPGAIPGVADGTFVGARESSKKGAEHAAARLALGPTMAAGEPSPIGTELEKRDFPGVLS